MQKFLKSLIKQFPVFLNLSLCIVFYAVVSIHAEEITVACVGDIRLNGYIGDKIKKHGFEYPFKKVQSLLSSADVTYGNLECAVAREGTAVEKEYTFRADPETLAVLTYAGFDIVDLANNHSNDYGTDAFLETMNNLQLHKIRHIGAGISITESRKPTVFESKGNSIAFLSYSNTFPNTFWATNDKPGVTPAYESYIRDDVKHASQLYDIVIVAYHGGDERSQIVKDSQKHIAHTAIRAGADMVIGHHPHVLQGIEVYKNKPIVYSLGNFLFLSKEPLCYDTMLIRAKISKEGVTSLEIIPAHICDAYVRQANAKEAQRILENLKTLSSELSTTITVKGNKGIIKFE